MNPQPAHTVQVDLPHGRHYPILIGESLLDHAELVNQHIPGHAVFVLSDTNVAPLYLDKLRQTLGERLLGEHIIPAGEASKSFDQWQTIQRQLADLRAARDTCIVALGGGVVGDLAGFIAATWMRGVPFVQLPTSLLAMVDSSVGGKTAINLPEGKNLVGAFHQPAAVIADISTLRTLPQRELKAGLAEVVKYAAIADAELFSHFETQGDAWLAGDANALADAVRISCEHKARIVAEDEREQGRRALLNFGHTFGHAIEAEAGYGTILHGEAVSIGMVMAAELSAKLGLTPANDAVRLKTLLNKLGLPTEKPASISHQAMLARMQNDKKNLSGQLRLILWRGLGEAFVHRTDVTKTSANLFK